jgi:transcriptional regulator with XRE-family HTH domain
MTNFELKPKVLVEARRAKNMTPALLAIASGYSENMIRRFEAGDRQPSERGLFRMAEVLNLPWKSLVRKASRHAA